MQLVDHRIRHRLITIPGITPATNRLPIEVSVAVPYRMKGIDGGIIMASPEALATREPTNLGLYPSSKSIGIVMDPTAAQVATPEPEIAP